MITVCNACEAGKREPHILYVTCPTCEGLCEWAVSYGMIWTWCKCGFGAYQEKFSHGSCEEGLAAYMDDEPQGHGAFIGLRNALIIMLALIAVGAMAWVMIHDFGYDSTLLFLGSIFLITAAICKGIDHAKKLLGYVEHADITER